MHHHRGRIRRRRLHERRTKGCDLRARRRAEQPHLDGPFCGYTLRAEATHLHRHRRGQLRPAAATGTRTAPRSRTLPLGTFRAGMQGCQRASDKVWRGSLLITLEQAEEIPLEGVFTAEDRQEPLRTLFENGLQRGAETGWNNLDENCTFETGRLAVWTGRTGEGKSEFIDELVLRLCLRHEWKIGFFSPENMPMEYHLAKLAEKLTGHPFRPGPGMTEALYSRTTRWLTDNVTHILPDSGSYTVDCILEKARQLVRRRGVRILVVDPLNRIDQQLEPGQTELQYITSLLNKLSRFALQHKCLVILVAHPRKVNRNTTNGELARVEMNDINGSANFGNMADFCFTVDRNDGKEIVTIYIDKVRFKHLAAPTPAPSSSTTASTGVTGPARRISCIVPTVTNRDR